MMVTLGVGMKMSQNVTWSALIVKEHLKNSHTNAQPALATAADARINTI